MFVYDLRTIAEFSFLSTVCGILSLPSPSDTSVGSNNRDPQERMNAPAPAAAATTETTQHASLYLAHRRTLVSWLLDIAGANNLGPESDPFPIVHRTVAVLDRLMALSQLPQLCAVSAARLPLMAVACLRIAGGGRARDALSPSFLNEVCEDRYSEAIITAMESLLTSILQNLVAEEETKPPHRGPCHTVDGEAMTGEEEEEEESEGGDGAFTSRDWIGFLMAQSGDKQGPELSGNNDGDRATMEYANFLSDLFLQEESVYRGEYSARIIATAAIALVRGQSYDTIESHHRTEVLSCIEVMSGLLSPALEDGWVNLALLRSSDKISS